MSFQISRQMQSFFPQEQSSNPNFQSSPSDVYFVDGNNQVQDTKPKQFVPNPKFSPNLQADLYNQQYGAQQQPQHHQQQQSQYPQYVQQQQQYTPQQSQPQFTSSGKPFYPTPDGNEVNLGEVAPQHQYSPQSQHYVDNSNFVYTEPPQFESPQSPYDQGFSQVVTGSYAVGGRPGSPQPVNILPQHRPGYSLYNPNQQIHYGGRPVYQSQHNYHLRPPSPNGYGGSNEGGGLMESISNFFTNIGQGAAELFSDRPPVNQYQPPPSVSSAIANRPPPHPYNQPFGGSNQQLGFGGPQFAGLNGNPVNQFSKAIEEITRNDDYQCIPKVICQMVGSQRRQQSILSSPIFSA